MDNEAKEIRLEDLIPFRFHSLQMYQDERLELLMNSIGKLGLMSPIIVRPIANEKYEIICGHNRVKAMKKLGYSTIMAYVRYKLSDNEAIALFYDSNLNQQSFLDWNYSQRIEAVKYIEKLIKDNARQGKRTDLEENKDETSVYSRQKLKKKQKRSTTRDRMACRLGISTATLSKYRKIIHLSDDIVETIGRLLDQKLITFEAAYRISGLRDCEIKLLMNYIENSPDKKIDIDKLKLLLHKIKDADKDTIYPISKTALKELLVTKRH